MIRAAGFQQFVIDTRKLIPTASQCVIGGIGYLQEEDLNELDTAIDTYVNGRMFLNKASAEQAIAPFVVRCMWLPENVLSKMTKCLTSVALLVVMG